MPENTSLHLPRHVTSAVEVGEGLRESEGMGIDKNQIDKYLTWAQKGRIDGFN